MNLPLYCPVCRKQLAKAEERYACAGCGRSFPVVQGIPSLIVDTYLEEGFNPRLFALLAAVEKTHCWFVFRRELILGMLRRYVPALPGKTMLEIGCGHGSMLEYLRANTGVEAVGSDVYREGLALSRSKDISLFQLDASHLPFRDAFDVVGLFDVIEHVDDDGHVLQECHRALKEGGKLFVTVPAFPSLWSVFDDISCHKRRYRRAGLVRKITGAGFSVEKCSYFMFCLFPIVYLMRKRAPKKNDAKADLVERCARYFRIHPLANALALWVLRCENRLMRYLDFPWGLSLLIVARKEARAA